MARRWGKRITLSFSRTHAQTESERESPSPPLGRTKRHSEGIREKTAAESLSLASKRVSLSEREGDQRDGKPRERSLVQGSSSSTRAKSLAVTVSTLQVAFLSLLLLSPAAAAAAATTAAEKRGSETGSICPPTESGAVGSQQASMEETERLREK